MIKCIVVGASGRMGNRLIVNIAENDNLELVGAIEYSGSPKIGFDAGLNAGTKELGVKISNDIVPLLKNADVVINFATNGVIECAKLCAAENVAMVIGTTTLGDDGKAFLKQLADHGAKIMVAGNMSIGINLLYKLTSIAAEILGDAFDVEITEMHHNRKQDAPSGTAARLAEVICETLNRTKNDYRYGRQGVIGPRTKREIGIHSLRGGDVVGDHTVIFAADGERLELTHRASSRDTFAKGALRAAQWLQNQKPGLYDMQDVLGLK